MLRSLFVTGGGPSASVQAQSSYCPPIHQVPFHHQQHKREGEESAIQDGNAAILQDLFHQSPTIPTQLVDSPTQELSSRFGAEEFLKVGVSALSVAEGDSVGGFED